MRIWWLALLLAGCTLPIPVYWMHDDPRPGQWQRDRYACERENMGGECSTVGSTTAVGSPGVVTAIGGSTSECTGRVDQALYRDCLEARGWRMHYGRAPAGTRIVN